MLPPEILSYSLPAALFVCLSLFVQVSCSLSLWVWLISSLFLCWTGGEMLEVHAPYASTGSVPPCPAVGLPGTPEIIRASLSCPMNWFSALSPSCRSLQGLHLTAVWCSRSPSSAQALWSAGRAAVGLTVCVRGFSSYLLKCSHMLWWGSVMASFYSWLAIRSRVIHDNTERGGQNNHAAPFESLADEPKM